MIRMRVGFSWFTDELTRRWETEEIQRRFTVPRGWHPVILNAWGLEVAEGAISELIAVPDVDPLVFTTDVTTGPLGLVTTPMDTSQSMPRWARTGFLKLISDSDYSSVDYSPVIIRDSLTWRKSNSTHNWYVTLDFTLERGSLMWWDEWARFLRDKRNVSSGQRDAGEIYYQVGDEYQIGRREYE